MVPTGTLTRAAAQIVEAAESFLSCVSDFDPSGIAPADCVVVSDTAARLEKAAGALRLVAGARAVQCGAHKERGVVDPALWLARQAGTTGKDARQGLELVRRLEDHPETKNALLAGAVSVAQAKEIARAEAEMPGNEHELLDVARDGDLGKLRETVREKVLTSTPVDELHLRQLAARRFHHWRDGLGMICFDGALPPETGIPFVNRIEREAARRLREAKRTGPSARFDAYAADALVSLFSSSAPEGSGRRAPNAEVVVVCDLYAWRRGRAHDGEPCHLIGGGPIPVDLAKELAHDAFLKIVLHDGKDIQKVKHVGRRYTAELLTALNLGPVPAFSGRACAGCKQTWRLQYDHDDPIAHTGETSIDNVQDLCFACHAEKTERDRQAGLLGRKAKARGQAKPGGPLEEPMPTTRSRSRPSRDRRPRDRRPRDRRATSTSDPP